ncbi:unnamed protein product (macronuclear) [Paramecium tetraurelia]|uniref:Protein kinase domain-containing protein n=1 Tax=Paramecium tetraurelia TaxID=5888 RepID=A0DJY1_PARTE|nr:uncharacterized protein GSPATT00017692001 [Paramecium tetraurelia]CAK83348.1 unnamed protein product [Paramecium tetraurelia]|eukprot:XP_001450745.1 hypothetical protein (macronuclear) [Paramecium tetraurelia strain d4-2]
MDSIDYKEARFKFQGIRKHFFKDVTYHITVFDDIVTIGATPDCPNPKYRITLNLDTKINWEINKNRQELEYFEIDYQTGKKIFHAQAKDLLKFKEILTGKVMFEGIGDLFKPIFQVGKGSSAKVYSARNVLDKRVYAVKAIQKSFLQNQEHGDGMAFQSEVQILKTLSQYEQNFLVLKEIYAGDSTFYLVTSYLEGLSLTGELEKAKTLPEKRLPIHSIKMIMWKLLTNLKILHSHRIIHRDLKPDNLMFARKNDYSSLILVDFGLATSELQEKYLFRKCGTPGYVAPEVLSSRNGQKYNCRVDIFSAGCILYRLLTGQSLFQGQNFEEVLRSNRHCHMNLELHQDGNYITEQSLDLLRKMLNKNGKNRINAIQALQHPFVDQNSEFSTQAIQNSSQQLIKNVIHQLNLAELESKYNSQIEIGDEKNSRINDLKKYSSITEVQYYQLSLSAKRSSSQFSGTFFQKEPLSVMHTLKLQSEQPLKNSNSQHSASQL